MMSLSLTYYLCLAMELLYPTYASFRALKSSVPTDDTQWLTYWVVYAFLSTFEAVASPVIAWIPLYYEAKLSLVIWLIAPQTQGALLLYENHICPFLEKHAKRLDPIFENMDKTLNSKYVGEFAKLSEKYGPTVAEQAIAYAKANADKIKAGYIAAGNTDAHKAN